MFTLKKDLNTIIASRRSPYSALNKNAFLIALQKKDYSIYFHYDKVEECIVYEAVRKAAYLDDDIYPPLVSVNMDAFRTISFTTEYQLVLAYYLVKTDQNLEQTHPEMLRQIYSSIIPDIEPLFNLSNDELEERKDSRDDFIAFSNELNTTSVAPISSNSGVELSLIIQPDTMCYGESLNDFLVTLLIGNKKKYVVKSIVNFIDEMNEGKPKKYGKNLVFDNKMESLSPESQNIVQSLIKHSYRFNSTYILSTDLVEFLYDLKGITVAFKDDDYIVSNDEVKVSVSIDSQGKASYEPSFTGYLMAGKNKYMIVDTTNNKFTFLDNSNLYTNKLLFFITTHQKFNFNTVADIFSKRVYPIVKKDISVSDDFKKKINLSVLEIGLYVDLDDDSNLTLKTVYSCKGQTYTSSDLSKEASLVSQASAYVSALKEFGYLPEETVKEEERINKFLTSDLSFLNTLCTLFLSSQLKTRSTLGKSDIRINATSNISWLDVSLSSDKYSQEELIKIFSAYRKKRKFYRFNDNIIYLDVSLEDVVKTASDLDIDKGFEGHKKLPLYQVFKLPVVSSLGIEVNCDQNITSIISDIKGFKDYPIKPDSIFTKNMRPYQVTAFKWLAALKRHSLSGILADDMGLGKTLETIAFIQSLSDTKPILIITPKSLIFNWEREFIKWDEKAKVTLINGSKEAREKTIREIKPDEKSIFVTSYESLRNDESLYKNLSFSLVILDEAQYIKNAFALKTRAVKKIKSDTRLVLTGTPIENSLLDLWSIFDFLMPGYLLSYSDFNSIYSSDILSDESKKEDKKRLISKITPFVLRRTKGEVLKDLPKKTTEIRLIEMKDKERDVYQAYLAKARNEMDEDYSKKAMSILSALTRLREICLDPTMFLENYNELSAKLEVTENIINEAVEGGHKVIVFSSFVKSLEHLGTLLKKDKINTLFITGDTKPEDRVSIAEEFNTQPDNDVILVSLKAGGTGLNLIGGDIVIHLNPWWNLAAEEQATDRAYRIGQVNKVTVIKMVCKDSIEEKVIELQNQKGELSKTFIQSGDQGITSLNQEAIKYLLS